MSLSRKSDDWTLVSGLPDMRYCESMGEKAASSVLS
jgi:hypothetical protein